MEIAGNIRVVFMAVMRYHGHDLCFEPCLSVDCFFVAIVYGIKEMSNQLVNSDHLVSSWIEDHR